LLFLGRIFSVIAFLESIANLLTNVLTNYIYEKTVRISPSVALYILSSLATIPFILGL